MKWTRLEELQQTRMEIMSMMYALLNAMSRWCLSELSFARHIIPGPVRARFSFFFFFFFLVAFSSLVSHVLDNYFSIKN